MMVAGSVVVVGGSSGLGREIARHYSDAGREVVLTSRDAGRAATAAADIGSTVTGIALDLAEPEQIADALAAVGPVTYLVIAGVERDANSVRNYNMEGARKLAVIKLVGYTEVVHTLLDRFTEDASVVLFGGLAKDRPYVGSTTVTTVNGAVTTMINALATELAPIRFNAIHPGIVGDSPYWADKQAALDATLARTPTGRLVMTADIVDAVVFLLENPAVNDVNLRVDGGTLLL